MKCSKRVKVAPNYATDYMYDSEKARNFLNKKVDVYAMTVVFDENDTFDAEEFMQAYISTPSVIRANKVRLNAKGKRYIREAIFLVGLNVVAYILGKDKIQFYGIKESLGAIREHIREIYKENDEESGKNNEVLAEDQDPVEQGKRLDSGETEFVHNGKTALLDGTENRKPRKRFHVRK